MGSIIKETFEVIAVADGHAVLRSRDNPTHVLTVHKSAAETFAVGDTVQFTIDEAPAPLTAHPARPLRDTNPYPGGVVGLETDIDRGQSAGHNDNTSPDVGADTGVDSAPS